MLELLKTFSWQELRQHPWRNAAAVLAVMLGVALAFSVHLINASALDEFAQATRSVAGQSDLELRAVQGHFDEALYQRVAQMPGVMLASPVLEVGSYMATAQGKRSLRVIGIDALTVLGVSPDLMPLPEPGQATLEATDQVPGNQPTDPARAGRWVLFAPGLAQQFALLGVLGLSGRARLALVLWESLALGLVGSAAGLALGAGLAALALRLLGGDLGGGFFGGAAPALQFSACLLYTSPSPRDRTRSRMPSSA